LGYEGAWKLMEKYQIRLDLKGVYAVPFRF
jgi:hypothetical protein